jgi:hypothetical protein
MSAASTESTMSFGVTGKWCDIDGVWIDPVMAQMMMTLPLSDGDVGIDRPRVRSACTQAPIRAKRVV